MNQYNMAGQTELHLEPDDVVRAIEFWLNEKVFKEQTLVVDVEPSKADYDGTYNGLLVKVLPAEDAVEKSDLEDIAELAREAIMTGGDHHKIWYLERILEAVGVPLEEWRERYEWEEGIAP